MYNLLLHNDTYGEMVGVEELRRPQIHTWLTKRCYSRYSLEERLSSRGPKTDITKTKKQKSKESKNT